MMPYVLKGAGAALVAAALLGSQAMAQTSWSGSSSPEDLRYRLDVLDAELADIRARLGGTVGSVAQQPGGGGGSGAQMGQLENELRRLTAAVEEMQNRLDRIAADATRRFGDIEFRLNELEGNPVGGEVQPLGGGGGDGPAVAIAEQGDLDRAAEDVRQGRFDQAMDRLRRFMNDYPTSVLTGHAWYWMGESQLVRGIHADAARSYLNGYNFNRRGPYAPHNLYRLGVVLGRLGQLNEACLTLREVGIQFPAAPDGLVQKATGEASQLACG